MLKSSILRFFFLIRNPLIFISWPGSRLLSDLPPNDLDIWAEEPGHKALSKVLMSGLFGAFPNLGNVPPFLFLVSYVNVTFSVGLESSTSSLMNESPGWH